jgi:hypothetical protein
MLSKLSVVSLSIGALLVLSVLTLTTTSAYAQPQGRGNSQACPVDFTLNRGVCQAEPTPAPLDCEEGYELVDDDTCRTLEPTRFHSAFCPPGSERASYTDPQYGFHDRCVLIGSGSPPFEDSETVDPTCDTLYKAPNEVVVLENYDRPVFRHETICAFYEVVDPVPQGNPICDIGTLNEASGMCEVKPGNRGGNRA